LIGTSALWEAKDIVPAYTTAKERTTLNLSLPIQKVRQFIMYVATRFIFANKGFEVFCALW